MVKPSQHFSKHGYGDLIAKGLSPVTPQQYFDDANRFVNGYKNGNTNFKLVKEMVNTDTNLSGSKIYKLLDQNTGRGGFVSNTGELVSFWYQ
jgi:hypothetical protein